MTPVPKLSVVVPTFNNVAVLRQCLASWQRFAEGESYELIVIEDGCRDETPEVLAAAAASEWGRRHLRWLHEDNVHELRATNRGFGEARGAMAMTWQDDMFLRAAWFVPELIAAFDRHREIGMLCLSRGLQCLPCDEPIATWNDVVDWKRLQSTIGPPPFNWLQYYEVDAVIRPWAVRRECLNRVGMLDEAFVPTGWDEADLAFRIRAAGWRVATHGYERLGAFQHLGSSTLSKYPLNLERDLRNGRLFFSRWTDAIRRDSSRPRRRWLRPMTAGAWRHTVRAAINYGVPSRRRAILRGEQLP